jgi:hypothetical protein
MPVRVTDIPAFQGSPINAAPMNPNAAGAVGQALGSLAQSIGGVSDAFGQHAQRLQKMENVNTISTERNRLSEDYTHFQVENQKEMDPEKRIQNTLDFLGAQDSAFKGADFNPYVRETLTSHFDEFATRARIASVEDAANLSIKRATQALGNEVSGSYRDNDRGRFDGALKLGRDAGIVTPEQELDMTNDFDRHTQFQSNSLQAEEMPTAALEALEKDDFLTVHPNLFPEDVDKLKRFAKQQIQVKRGEEFDTLEEGILKGKVGGSDIEAAENLTEKDRRALYDTLQKEIGESPISQMDYLRAWKSLDGLREMRMNPKVSQDQYRLLHNELRSRILSIIPPSKQGDIKKELGYLSPAGRDPNEPLKKSDLLSQRKAYMRAGFGRALARGNFGDMSEEGDPIVQERAARIVGSIFLNEGNQFFLENPDASTDEIDAFIDKTIKAKSGGDAPITKSTPKPIDITEVPSPNRSKPKVVPIDKQIEDLYKDLGALEDDFEVPGGRYPGGVLPGKDPLQLPE